MKKIINTLLIDCLKANNITNNIDIIIEKPKDTSLGDYASPLCFQLSKILKENPIKLAEVLSTSIQSPFVKVSHKNGFINFIFKNEYLWEKLNEQDFKINYKKTKDKILLEYISANPTGPLHIGHARWAVIGSVLNNILTFAGYDVTQEFYINDAGQQVKNFYDSIDAIKQGNDIPENGYHGRYMYDLANKDEDPLIENIKDQQKDLKNLKVEIKNWYSEKTLHESNKVSSVINKLNSLNVTEEIDQALWLKTTLFGDSKDRVLVKNDGNYTYFAVDIAYHLDKFDRNYTHLINIWGADHHGYVARVRAAIIALKGKNFKTDDQFKVILGQLVSLKKSGQAFKMSKRSGELVTLKEVLKDIGSDPIRYFLAQSHPNTHIEFDLDLAKTQNNENPVFYIQYAHARIQSILKNEIQELNKNFPINLNNYERQLIYQCLQFNDMINSAATNLSTQALCQYTYELAKNFHTFYETCPIMKADIQTQSYRKIILLKVRETLQKCLKILDITAPNSM